MHATGVLEWLRSSLSHSGPSSGKHIVRFTNPGDYRKILQAIQARRSSDSCWRGVRRLGIIHGLSCPAAPEELPPAFRQSLVVEEDPLVRIHAVPASLVEKGIPWGVRRIRAPEVWSRTTGHQVKVGVIDTGVDFLHPDLRHSLERGINLIHRTMLPQDDNGHGTHIAGTIAAANQLQGMIGVAPRATIYPVKAFDYNGTAYVSDIILAIDWCVRNRMHVVNMSFGMQTKSKALLSAVNNAYHSGVLIVASSGNDGKRGDIDYPAGFAQTIAVGAINRQGKVAKFCNRSSLIDIYAPGERIVSSWLRNRLREMSGTSMATSHVTGAIALLLAHKPGLTPEQIKWVIRRSARPLRQNKKLGSAGELDVVRMLRVADRLP